LLTSADVNTVGLLGCVASLDPNTNKRTDTQCFVIFIYKWVWVTDLNVWFQLQIPGMTRNTSGE